ncbi:MAG: hypothetical protein R2710_17100 [Acidimicrobiales bacterium]
MGDGGAPTPTAENGDPNVFTFCGLATLHRLLPLVVMPADRCTP